MIYFQIFTTFGYKSLKNSDIIGQEVNGLHQLHSFWPALMKTTLLRMQLIFSLLNTKMQKNSTIVRINILYDNPL